MTHAIRLVVLGLVLIGFGCTGDEARRLFETAQFEEKQRNEAHAKELYQEIVTKHPRSEYAQKAHDRLRDLGTSP